MFKKRNGGLWILEKSGTNIKCKNAGASRVGTRKKQLMNDSIVESVTYHKNPNSWQDITSLFALLNSSICVSIETVLCLHFPFVYIYFHGNSALFGSSLAIETVLCLFIPLLWKQMQKTPHHTVKKQRTIPRYDFLYPPYKTPKFLP